MQGDLSSQKNSEQQITKFFRLFLDMAGIISTTKGGFEPIEIGDVKFLGSKRDISGILSSGQVSIEDWICSILLQGWVRMHEPEMVVSDDLKTKIWKWR